MPLLRARAAKKPSPCVNPTCQSTLVTDINLGGSASGWDVAKRFRSEKPDMPVVYISGEQSDPERSVPGSLFVAKPIKTSNIF